MKKEKINKNELEYIGSFLEKLAEKSESVYWLSSPDLQKIQYISPAFEKVWGIPRQLLYDNPSLWDTCLHPDDLKDHHPIKALAEKIATQGEHARYEENYRIVRPGGEIRWIMDRGFPICTETGECCGVTGVAIDVTRQKLLEEQLKKETERANKAKAEAEQANQAKSYVLGQITPELYLPFEFIEAAAHLVDIHARIQDRRDCIDRIIELAREGKEMVKCVVDSADLTSKIAKNFSPSWFDLKILFESSLARQMDWALKRNIHLVLDYPDKTPMWVHMPKYSISLILGNMMNIAISECLRERLEIKVNLIKKSADNMDIEISILPSGEPLEIERTLLGKDSTRDLKTVHEAQRHLILESIQNYTNMLKGEIKVTEKNTEGLRFFLTLNVPIDTVHPYAQSPWKAYQPDTRVLIVDSEGRGDVIRQHLGEKNIDVILNHEDIKLKLLTAEKEGYPYHIVMIGRVGKGELQFSRASKLETQLRKIRVKERLMLVLISDELPSYNVGYDTVIYGQLLPTDLQKELAIAYERWLDMPKRAN